MPAPESMSDAAKSKLRKAMWKLKFVSIQIGQDIISKS